MYGEFGNLFPRALLRTCYSDDYMKVSRRGAREMRECDWNGRNNV